MKHRIHINKHIIKANKRNGTKRPPITVKSYKRNVYTDEVHILDTFGEVIAKVVFKPKKPLSCGAEVWIETEGQLSVHTVDDDGNEKKAAQEKASGAKGLQRVQHSSWVYL